MEAFKRGHSGGEHRVYKDRKAEELQEGGWCSQIPGYVWGPGVSGELCSIQYCMSFARLGVGNRCPEGRSWLNALAIACSETTLVPWACCFSVVSDSLQLHGLQHAKLPCPSPSSTVCSNSCPLSQ